MVVQYEHQDASTLYYRVTEKEGPVAQTRDKAECQAMEEGAMHVSLLKQTARCGLVAVQTSVDALQMLFWSVIAQSLCA